MSNIKSFSDYASDGNDSINYNYAGGHNSAIGIDDPPNSHTVHVYSDGFIVDNGAFRPINLPENLKFINDIKNGIAPQEFQDGSNEVSIHLIDHQNQPYQKDTTTSGASSVGNTCDNKTITRSMEYKLSDNNTTLRIKLIKDEVINLKISQDATIGDLIGLISNESGMNVNEFIILSGFPPKIINKTHNTTLYNADIINCTVIQKKSNLI